MQFSKQNEHFVDGPKMGPSTKQQTARTISNDPQDFYVGYPSCRNPPDWDWHQRKFNNIHNITLHLRY